MTQRRKQLSGKIAANALRSPPNARKARSALKSLKQTTGRDARVVAAARQTASGKKRTRRSHAMETSEARSAIMRAVTSENTTPEMTVRRLLHSLGYRYRLHTRSLPGTPDIVFASRKKTVFIHGCFWHGHQCARGARVPKSNSEYWIAKIDRNRDRDGKNRRRLRGAGWAVLVVWECELRDVARLTRRLNRFLSGSQSRS